MQYVKFGSTGMDVSRICLGMMSFGKPGEESYQALLSNWRGGKKSNGDDNNNEND